MEDAALVPTVRTGAVVRLPDAWKVAGQGGTAGDQLHPRAAVAPETLCVVAALARSVRHFPKFWPGRITSRQLRGT